MRKLLILSTITLSACGSSSDISVPSEQLSAAAALPDSAYTERLANCGDSERVAEGLGVKFRTMMNASSNPRMTQFAHASFDSGEVYAVMTEFEPGDPGVTSRNIDYAAVRADCSWAYLTTDYDM